MNRQKGSYTVEVSMVFTVVVLAMLALIFMFAYMLQKVSLMRVNAYAAQQGAEIWTDSRKDIDNTVIDVSKDRDSLYYRVNDNLLFGEMTFEWSNGEITEKSDLSSLPARKMERVKNYIFKSLKTSILKPRNTNVNISYKNNLLRGQIIVEITQEISIPFGNIKAFFGGKDTVVLKSRSASAVVEPAEYIRNVDLAVELSKKIGDGISLKDIINKIRNDGEQ